MRGYHVISCICTKCGNQLELESINDVDPKILNKIKSSIMYADNITGASKIDTEIYIKPCYSCISSVNNKVEDFIQFISNTKDKE